MPSSKKPPPSTDCIAALRSGSGNYSGGRKKDNQAIPIHPELAGLCAHNPVDPEVGKDYSKCPAAPKAEQAGL